jgi:predicted membrane-bound spermidine synthase
VTATGGTLHDDSRVHTWLVGAAASIVLALQHAQRIYALYVAPSDARLSGFAAAAIGLGLGAVVARALVPLSERLVPYCLCTLALCVGASSVAPFTAFTLGAWAPRVACCAIAATVCSSAVAVVATYRAVGRAGVALGVIPFVLQPLRAAGGLLLLIAVETAAARAGVLRSGLLLAGIVVTLAMAYPRLYWVFYGDRFPRLGLVRGTGVVLSAAVFASLHAAESLAPLDELARFPDEVVFRTEASGPVYTVVAAPGGYELFGDGQLVVASLDEHRRTRALVDPVLRFSRRPRRVLLLNGGLGLVEREILRDPRVEQLVVVVPEPTRLALARSLAFVAERTGDALDSPRLRTVLSEPLAWLAGERPDRFDVIVADFPWPLGYGEGKLYTRYAFSRLAVHLTTEGVVVVPAASGFSAPDVLAGIVATFESTGLRAATYHAAVPTIGLASFLVGSTNALDLAGPALGAGSDGAAKSPAGDWGVDLQVPSGGRISTLHDQTVVAAFADAREIAEAE